MRHVIIGGGIAGTTAAEEIRKRDENAEITIISLEKHPLYSRVLLPHYVKGKTPREKVFLKKAEWYEEKHIEYMSGVSVSRVDTTNTFVETSEMREIPYDRLLITTGVEVNLFPEDRRGVCYFYTMDDADLLLDYIREVEALPESERSVAVYGGGFLAIEFINIFAHFRLPTSVIMRNGGFWSRVLSEGSQALLQKHGEAHGLTFYFNETDPTLVGEAEIEAVKISQAIIPARIFGVGIGVHRDFSLLDESGIEKNQGILANDCLETTVENVYTAGDVAEFSDKVIGRQHVVGNWMNAMMQARTVAKTMTGERTEFSLVSSYATNLLGKEIVFIGDVNREAADEVEQLVLDEENSAELFHRGGKTVGALLIGDVTKRAGITNAIKQQERYA